MGIFQLSVRVLALAALLLSQSAIANTNPGVIASKEKQSQSKVIKAGVMESTPVPIVAEWHINTETQPGEHFSARVVEDFIKPSGEVLIPKNSRVVGRVVAIDNARSFHRDAKVDILFEKIVLPDNVQSLEIEADGMLSYKDHDKLKFAKIASKGVMQTSTGAALGAITGFKFGGILGSSSSSAGNMIIGAAAGAGVALISFIAQKGEKLEVHPGLPMTLNIISLEEPDIKEQALPQISSNVKVNVIKNDKDFLSIEIDNGIDQDISLGNLKVIDALGYSVLPINVFKFHDKTHIPAKSRLVYDFKYPKAIKNTRQWLVLTDNFNKKEYFRVEI